MSRQGAKRRVFTVAMLAAAMFFFIFLNVSVVHGAQIILSQTSYLPEQTVEFEILYGDGEEQSRLEILSPVGPYQMFGENDGTHRFLPPGPGTYKIMLISEDNIIVASSLFDVSLNSVNAVLENESRISTNREFYFLGEQAVINLQGQSADESLYVIDPQGRRYEFLGENKGSVVAGDSLKISNS